VIAVLTTPLVGARYVDATVAAIAAQGPRVACVLVSDGPWTGALPDGWELDEAPKATHAVAFRRMCRLAFDRGAPFLLALEHDIELAAGAVSWMEDFPVPDDVALVQFLNRTIAPGAYPGLYRSPAHTLSMMQAMKIPRRTLELHSGQPRDRNARNDLAAVLAGARLGLHVPDLVRHVGRVSAWRGDREMPEGTNWRPGFCVANLAGPRALGHFD